MAVISEPPMLASDTELTADDIILADNIKQYRTITVRPNDSFWGNTYGPNCYLVKDSSQIFPLRYEITRGDSFISWATDTDGVSISGNRLTIAANCDSEITVTGVFIGPDPILNNNDWATINRITKAGTAAQYWSVGDYKEVSVAEGTVDQMTVSASTYRAVIIGINHNPTYENPNSIDFAIGQNTDGTDICFYGPKVNNSGRTGVKINASATTANGWTSSQMYLTYLPQFYNLLSGNTGLKAAMIAPKKYTHNATGGIDNNTEANVTLSEDPSYKMFLMSEFEVFGTRSYANSYEQDKQAQYEYYSSSGLAKSKKRYRTDIHLFSSWWERSAACNSTNTDSFCGVASAGYANSYIANSSDSGLVPCFRVGFSLLRQKVGGTIFYIDSSTNTYTFYDADDNPVDAPEVGTDCTDWTYEKSGTGADKYYVYNQNAMFNKDRTGTELNPFITWTYLGTENQSFIDNAEYTSDLPSGKQEYEYYGYYGRVYESLYGTYTGTAIGTGKTNTFNMMSLRDGVYIQGSNLRWRGETMYSETIWSICNLFNKGLYNINGNLIPNTTGCNDWYIPSLIELLRMKDHIGARNFSEMFLGGDPDYTFVWTSSEYNRRTAYSWAYDNAQDTGSRNSPKRNANANFALALTRSF